MSSWIYTPKPAAQVTYLMQNARKAVPPQPVPVWNSEAAERYIEDESIALKRSRSP
jgi:hypothetical protein